MTRQEILSRRSRPESSEFAELHRSVRQNDLDMWRFRGTVHRLGMHGCGRTYNNPANQLSDGQLAQRVGTTLGRLAGSRHEFSRKTECILRAACAQYLGYYPPHIPSKSEIKTILGEMGRMHGHSWEKGIGCMEHQFRGTENAIREIQRYAKANGILPDSF